MTEGFDMQALADYRDAFDDSWARDAPLESVRFVVLDCETTGMDPRRHRIVSVGAVGIDECRIDLGDTFEAVLQIRHNTASTLVHGITRDATRSSGVPEAQAIAKLLGYLRDAVLVGHHIRYDIDMLNAALDRHSEARLLNTSVDTGDLALRLEADGGFGDDPHLNDLSLDGLCKRFSIVPYDRHTAAGDAFLAAQIFLRLLRIARRCGRDSLARLREKPPQRG
ncbi:MAG: 3'-5' exonuclease [Thiohalocapsa sp.]|nr:3'-5' exonuclease [Thiohalocapsa sp.]